MVVTTDDKRLDATREVNMRIRVYPRLVAQGKLTQAEADRKIEVMKVIARDYRGPDLFEGVA